MLKVKDFIQEHNLKNNVDVIGIIAKIGEFKSSSISKEKLVAREIYVCDDSWAMIKLIVRNCHAENSINYKLHQILFLKNVKPMKVKGRIVLVTINDSIMTLETNTSEALRLKHWQKQNMIDFRNNDYKQFLDLSSIIKTNFTDKINDSNILKANENCCKKNMSEREQEFYNNVNEDTQSNRVSKSKGSRVQNTKYDKLGSGLKQEQNPSDQFSDEEPHPKYMRKNSTENLKSNNEDCNKNIQDKVKTTDSVDLGEASQITLALPEINSSCIDTEDFSSLNKIKRTEEPKNRIIYQSSDEFILIVSDDENEKNRQPEAIEISIKEESPETKMNNNENYFNMSSSSSDVNYDVTNETFNMLMNSLPLEEEWNEEKDKYLVNFILKNPTKLDCLTTYDELLVEKPHIFQGSTPDALKQRVESLANVSNYFYLMKLCGGDKIRTEKEKCSFINRVEKLRKLMKIIPNEESSD